MSQQNFRQWQHENPSNGQSQIKAGSIVLVVEPHAMWRLFLKAVLTLYQYRVVTATTEDEAEAAKQAIDPPSLGLVIVDMHLSDDLQACTGLKLVERWKEADATLPSILMSDHPKDADLLALDRSNVSFLVKPFLRQDVLEVLARGIEREYLTNQLR